MGLRAFASGRVNLIGDHTDYYDATWVYFRAPVADDYGVVVVNQHDGSAGNPAAYEIAPVDASFCH